ncbi:MAG TPA: TVP38/TMEM64 family protein [Candidatus Methylomirabilis sp.]|nr:TVP38/TMEM64 family protein [Candidatus Methylomirabilis sp.]
MGQLIKKYRWAIGGVITVALVGYCVWLVYSDAPSYRFLVRLYVDKKFLKQTLRQWGILAPVLFMLLQALQVIISPIPGEATGFLGGYLFGEWLGLVYSTIGLTFGSVVSFWIGRWLGERYVRKLVSKEMWDKLGFIVEAEGVILCFIIYAIPGLPKDIICYLFGISPMPMWVFAVVSGLGRIPGTWVLSAQGAHVETGNYLQVILISAGCAAVALPLYYYRHRIVLWLRGRNAAKVEARPYAERLDRDKVDS